MNRITFPLNQQMTGTAVADLQDALRLLINRRVLLANDQTAARELAVLLTQERASQTFGRATGKLVSNFQREQGLQASGEVDEPTADALNTLLKQLDPFDPDPRPRTQVVSGVVRREDDLPLQGLKIRAAHEAEQRSLRLGEDITDAKGRYTIRYELLRELGGINLRVSALSEKGKLLQSSDLVQNAGPLQIIDLITPISEKSAAEQRIEGTIVLEHGVPADNLKLRLYRRDFGGKAVLLGETSTLEGGQGYLRVRLELKPRNGKRSRGRYENGKTSHSN